MADKYLKDFSAESPNLTDYIIMTGGTGNDSDYKALTSAMAKLLIETYAGSTLAGSQQSIQSALTAIGVRISDITVTDPNNDGNIVITLGGG